MHYEYIYKIYSSNLVPTLCYDNNILSKIDQPCSENKKKKTTYSVQVDN